MTKELLKRKIELKLQLCELWNKHIEKELDDVEVLKEMLGALIGKEKS